MRKSGEHPSGSGSEGFGRLSPDQCVQALRDAAAHLQTTNLSQRAYEQARLELGNTFPHPRTIAVRVGSWAGACALAGLATPSADTGSIRRQMMQERVHMLDRLRAAWWASDGEFHLWRYATWRSELPEGEQQMTPEAPVIARTFGSWWRAVEVAGIRPSGSFAPSVAEMSGTTQTLWTVGEARKLVRGYFSVHRTLPTEETWQPTRHLPSWELLCELLPPQPWPNLAGRPSRLVSARSFGGRGLG